MLFSTKTVIRAKDFDASIAFYTKVLNLTIAENYNDGDGSRGAILRIGHENSTAFIEISEISSHHSYYQEAFSESFQNDKVDIQIRTDNVQYWADRINEQWTSRGPLLRPWGSYYLYLKDPDGLQIIIYQEKTTSS